MPAPPPGMPVLALLGALVALAIAPATAPAQEAGDEPTIDSPYRWIDRGFRLGLSAGYLSTSSGVLDLGPTSGPMTSASVRARITDPISVEASLSFGDTERPVVDPRLATGPAVVDTVPLRWAALQGGLHLGLTGARTWHGLQPYVAFGAGMVIGVDEPRSLVLGEPSDTAAADFRFELNAAPVAVAAGGVEWLVSDRIGISFEARDHLWRLTTPDGFFREEILNQIERSGTPAPTERDWVHNVELSVGFWYYP